MASYCPRRPALGPYMFIIFSSRLPYLQWLHMNVPGSLTRLQDLFQVHTYMYAHTCLASGFSCISIIDKGGIFAPVQKQKKTKNPAWLHILEQPLLLVKRVYSNNTTWKEEIKPKTQGMTLDDEIKMKIWIMLCVEGAQGMRTVGLTWPTS